MKLFRGIEKARVDDKARLKLPAPVARKWDELYGDKRVFITSLDGVTVKVYPLREWERIEDMLTDHTGEKTEEDAARDERIHFNAMLRGSDESLDKQGRILVPAALREAVGTSCDVHITWAGSHLKVMSEKQLEETMARMAFTDDDNKRAVRIGA